MRRDCRGARTGRFCERVAGRRRNLDREVRAIVDRRHRGGAIAYGVSKC
ncbi:hypothetical protein E1H18_3053 [Caulobacter sp. RHG1]|nr:hypothetical protein [Caulobacter sp. RHG1]